MTAPTHAVGGWRGHGAPGIAGTNLQNAPVINGKQQQSYIMGMPVSRLPIRPVTSSMPNNGGGVPGTPVGPAAGNPSINTWDTRQETRQPMYGGWGPAAGWNDSGNAKMPGDTYGGDPQGKIGTLRPTQETNHQPGREMSNEKLVTRDRHVFFKVGNENSGRGSGNTDPPMDGPPRPALASINRTINWQQGSTYSGDALLPINPVNGNADDLSRPYTRNQDGSYVGEQGSGWSAVNGGVPGLWQPYGSYAGITGGPVKGIQSPVPQGQPGDGPRKVWSGPPHGLHSPTLPAYSPTIGYYMALPAQRAPRQDRPDNSTAAGQSFSQTVQPQGQTGTIAATPAGGLATNNVFNKINYAVSTGWRGMAGNINGGGGG